MKKIKGLLAVLCFLILCCMIPTIAADAAAITKVDYLVTGDTVLLKKAAQVKSSNPKVLQIFKDGKNYSIKAAKKGKATLTFTKGKRQWKFDYLVVSKAQRANQESYIEYFRSISLREHGSLPNTQSEYSVKGNGVSLKRNKNDILFFSRKTGDKVVTVKVKYKGKILYTKKITIHVVKNSKDIPGRETEY